MVFPSTFAKGAKFNIFHRGLEKKHSKILESFNVDAFSLKNWPYDFDQILHVALYSYVGSAVPNLCPQLYWEAGNVASKIEFMSFFDNFWTCNQFSQKLTV